jgi:Recombinase zinc beta ribbon domain
MVFCEHCDRPYLTQTAKAGKNRRIHDAPFYRHRVNEGHCTNRTVSARKLEPIVWAEVAKILRDPDMLRKGYHDSLQQQEYARARQTALLETLRKGVIKLEKERQKLTELYLDPDMNMTKNEYYEQKTRIDDHIKATLKEIEEKEAELASVPSKADLETLEIFASKIRVRLAENYVPSLQEQRQLFELLHIKVILGLDGTIKVNGWYKDENDYEESSNCLSSTSSTRCAHLPRPPPAPV